MSEGRPAAVPSMTGPAIYRIRVQGKLDAPLSGVLNILYELHLPVLSVECLEAE